MKILIIGKPASGKGTQAKLLSEYLGISLLSGGELLRQLPMSHPKYQIIHDSMLAGNLVPNDIMGQILKEHVSSDEFSKGYVLDGWMRQMSDKERFDMKPDVVLYLNVSEKEAISRTQLRKRADDTLEALEERFKVFYELTLPVLAMYREEGKLIEIDGNKSPDEVFEDIKVELKRRII